MTIIFKWTKYAYTSNAEHNALFSQIGFQTVEMLMLKTVKT